MNTPKPLVAWGELSFTTQQGNVIKLEFPLDRECSVAFVLQQVRVFLGSALHAPGVTSQDQDSEE